MPARQPPQDASDADQFLTQPDYTDTQSEHGHWGHRGHSKCTPRSPAPLETAGSKEVIFPH